MSQQAYFACVPHVPLLTMQEKQQNKDVWQSYDARIAEYDAFDPDLTVVFGGDHYANVHLKLAPTFIVGHKARAIKDCGGTQGELDVPMELSTALAEALVEDGFDIAVSYDMVLDHGFSNALGYFLHGKLNARPVIPVHINSLTTPRATMKRCRQIGEAIGRWASRLGKRVAFIGSGGLSHQTDFIFPQYNTAPTEEIRTFLVHGAAGGTISEEKWHGDIDVGMHKLSADLVSGAFKAPWINPEWDRAFLDMLKRGDLNRFDSWSDADILDKAGYGGGEVRMWVAAAAAGLAAGARGVAVDYYSGETTFAVGIGFAHSPTGAA